MVVIRSSSSHCKPSNINKRRDYFSESSSFCFGSVWFSIKARTKPAWPFIQKDIFVSDFHRKFNGEAFLSIWENDHSAVHTVHHKRQTTAKFTVLHTFEFLRHTSQGSFTLRGWFENRDSSWEVLRNLFDISDADTMYELLEISVITFLENSRRNVIEIDVEESSRISAALH